MPHAVHMTVAEEIRASTSNAASAARTSNRNSRSESRALPSPSRESPSASRVLPREDLPEAEQDLPRTAEGLPEITRELATTWQSLPNSEQNTRNTEQNLPITEGDSTASVRNTAVLVAPGAIILPGTVLPGSSTSSTEQPDASTSPRTKSTLPSPDKEEVACLFDPEVDGKLFCPICLGILSKPVQTSCGHRFCKFCYKRAVRTQPLQMSRNGVNRAVCPVDKTTVEAVFEDVAVAREIQNLSVQCRRKEAGCPWQGEYRNIESHRSMCLFEPVPCQLRCGNTVLRKEMDSHLDYCPKRREPCNLCGKIILPWDLKHLFFECPRMPIPCVFCDKRLRRDSIAEHTDELSGDCPGQEVPCRYQSLGCYTKCQRKDLSGHNELHRQEHMLLLLQRIEQLENKVNVLESRDLQLIQSSIQSAIQTSSETLVVFAIEYDFVKESVSSL